MSKKLWIVVGIALAFLIICIGFLALSMKIFYDRAKAPFAEGPFVCVEMGGYCQPRTMSIACNEGFDFNDNLLCQDDSDICCAPE